MRNAPHRRGALVLLLAGSTLTVMAGAVISPVLNLIRTDLVVDGTAAGLIITTHGLVIAVVSPLAGWATDRWGVRRPLAVGLLLYGLAGGAGLVLSSYPALIVSRAVFGVGAAIVFTGTTKALLTLYRRRQRDRVMGWRSTATSLGGVVWPLVGGGLGSLSWHGPFAAYLVGIPLAGLALAVLPEDAETASHQRGTLFGMLRAHPRLLAWYGLQFTGALLMYAIVVFLPLRLAELDVIAPAVVAVFTAVMAGTAGLVGLAYARIRSWLSYHRLLVLSVSLWVVAFTVLGLAAEPAMIVAGVVAFGLGQGLAFPALTLLVGDAVPAARRGSATAVSATANFLGQFLSPLVLGPLAAASSITSGYRMLAAGAGVILVLVLFSRTAAPPPEGRVAGHRSGRRSFFVRSPRPGS